MNVDYYTLLTRAVAGKDTLGRDKIYKDAYDLITRSHLDREVAGSHVKALEAAIRQIEDDFALEEGRYGNQARIEEVLSTGSNWKPWAVGAGALVLAIAVSAVLYGYVTMSKSPAVVAAAPTAPPPKVAKAREDVVMADLKAGEDGGSTGEGLPF